MFRPYRATGNKICRVLRRNFPYKTLQGIPDSGLLPFPGNLPEYGGWSSIPRFRNHPGRYASHDLDIRTERPACSGRVRQLVGLDIAVDVEIEGQRKFQRPGGEFMQGNSDCRHAVVGVDGEIGNFYHRGS